MSSTSTSSSSRAPFSSESDLFREPNTWNELPQRGQPHRDRETSFAASGVGSKATAISRTCHLSMMLALARRSLVWPIRRLRDCHGGLQGTFHSMIWHGQPSSSMGPATIRTDNMEIRAGLRRQEEGCIGPGQTNPACPCRAAKLWARNVPPVWGCVGICIFLLLLLLLLLRPFCPAGVPPVSRSFSSYFLFVCFLPFFLFSPSFFCAADNMVACAPTVVTNLRGHGVSLC